MVVVAESGGRERGMKRLVMLRDATKYAKCLLFADVHTVMYCIDLVFTARAPNLANLANIQQLASV